VNWTFETKGPNGLERMGWNRNSLKPEDKMIAERFAGSEY
jgi:hypothetical protein